MRERDVDLHRTLIHDERCVMTYGREGVQILVQNLRALKDQRDWTGQQVTQQRLRHVDFTVPEKTRGKQSYEEPLDPSPWRTSVPSYL